ncbi:MAG: hypothetical protein B7Z55_16565, partial [Planctomycetales bacterium 12-60-4]
MGDTANFNLDFLGNQLISLNDPLTLGILNIGDLTGGSDLVLTAGVNGTISFNNGGTAVINKTGDGTVAILANVGLQNQLTLNVAQGILVLGGIVDGVNGFTKNGDGTLVLRSANNFTGVNILNGGITLVSPGGNDLSVLGASSHYFQGTIVNSGATLAFNNDVGGILNGGTVAGNGGTSLNSEPLFINGQGFRNLGALRNILGRESNQVTGTVTLLGAARVQSELDTFPLPGSVITNDNELRIGGPGFTSITGAVTGSGDIIHYGVSGFRMQNVTAAQNFTGNLSSILGEIRADTSVGSQAASTNPYNKIASLSLRNSWLRLVFGNGNGAPTTNDKPDSRFSTTAPISMMSSQIYVENAGFTTGSSLFNYAVAQKLGVATLVSG